MGARHHRFSYSSRAQGFGDLSAVPQCRDRVLQQGGRLGAKTPSPARLRGAWDDPNSVAGNVAKAMTLSADQRGALEMLAEWRCCTGTTLLAHGFNIDMLAGLVRDGLATARREPV